MLPHLISCSDKLEGYNIVENMGIVTGLAIRVRTLENIAASHIQSLFGARSLTYLKLAHAARKNAFEEMIKNAEKLGADGIICVKYDSCEITKGAAEVFCYGSAVKIVKSKTEN